MLTEGFDPEDAQTLIASTVKQHAAEMVDAYSTLYALESRLQVARTEAAIYLDGELSNVA